MPKLQKPTILETLKLWINQLTNDVSEPTEQAMSMPDIYNNVGLVLNPTNASGGDYSQPYQRLVDCYLDGMDVYAIVAKEGKLYKYPVNISSGNVSLGDAQPVEIDYKPVANQQAFRVLQQADGKTRWFAFPAATAVLNRNGYTNSRKQYDNFIKHIEQGESEMPYLTFYHIGMPLALGQADFVERDGYTLLISGLFNDTPLAQQLAEHIDEWSGVSIAYDPVPNTIEFLEISQDVKIPVHTDGILRELSALEDIDSACLMTVFQSKEGEKNMDKTQKEKLLKLAGNNPQALAQVEELANQVDQTNQTIEAENLVRQASTQAVVTDAPIEPSPVTEPATTTPDPVQEPPAAPATSTPEFTLTDEAVQAIAEQLRSGFATELATATTTFQTKLDEAVTGLTTTLTGLQSRLDALEQTDQNKVAQALVDMPRNSIAVGYRPRTQTQAAPVTPKTEPTSDEIANETLAKIKAGQAAGKL